jgi:hypothetical protein
MTSHPIAAEFSPPKPPETQQIPLTGRNKNLIVHSFDIPHDYIGILTESKKYIK